MTDFTIKSSQVVTPEGVKTAFVIIKGGVITEVADSLPESYSGKVKDVGNRVLMPGVIDPHVHINEPGRTDWEGFETATKAAIAGGITMLVDMPLNSSPVTTTISAFDEKVAAAKNKLYTNVGLWGGLVPGNENEIKGLIQRGVLGFKAFLTHSGIDEFPNISEDDLRKAMPVIAKYGLPLLVHCELTTDDIPKITDNKSYQQYLASRPKEWEDRAIDMMIRLCDELNCRVHIVHLSSANSIKKLAEAKQRGLPITVETGQHYLFFNAEEIRDADTAFKCAPPIREKANNDQLWQALEAGIIDFVATDHSPAPPAIKELQSGDFTKAWGGISSVQFALPVLWTAARKRGFTISDITKWLCEKPAALAGLESSKGKIAKGYDADIIVLDEEKSFVVTEDSIRHRHKITPYLQESLFGIVEETYLSGVKVFDNGTIIEKNGNIITRS